MTARKKKPMTRAQAGALGGRPPKDAAEKVKRVVFYLAPNNLEALEAIARDKGFKSTTAYLADVARAIAVGERAP